MANPCCSPLAISNDSRLVRCTGVRSASNVTVVTAGAATCLEVGVNVSAAVERGAAVAGLVAWREAR